MSEREWYPPGHPAILEGGRECVSHDMRPTGPADFYACSRCGYEMSRADLFSRCVYPLEPER